MSLNGKIFISRLLEFVDKEIDFNDGMEISGQEEILHHAIWRIIVDNLSKPKEEIRKIVLQKVDDEMKKWKV
jgi:hypothetical protein